MAIDTYESAQKSYQNGDIRQARSDWENLAKKGDIRSMHRLYTSTKNPSEQDIKWLQKAAESGHVEAEFDYAVWLFNNERYQEAKKYLESASNNKFEKAQAFLLENKNVLPFLLEYEQGNQGLSELIAQYYWQQKNYEQAVKWHKRCVDIDSYCSFHLGLAYARGYGVNQDDKTAMAWYLRSATDGNVDSARNLAWLYEEGRGTAVNQAEAFKWMKIAAKKNYEYATVSLGRYYLYGIGTEKNPQEAIKLLSQFEKTNVTAAYHLGRLYYLGLGVDKNYDKSFRFFSSDLLADHAASIYYLAEHYRYGRGVRQDKKQAYELHGKSAEKGDPDAQFEVAYMSSRGEGVAKDERKAFYWYTQAAENGNAAAQNNLALMYVNGTSTTKDLYRGFRLYKQAAEKGSAVAQSNLANAYELGQGTARNYQQAVYWYARAAQQGRTGAQTDLNKILHKLTARYINAPGINLHTSPDPESAVVEPLNQGDTVYIISYARDWYEVFYRKNNSLGFVRTSNLK